ncbi:MAG: sugar ABC transporter substrate-binding protein [Propionibacteriaceae bacterium]|nr:sugar ABC transporter substrate-binding protein [Propionibacteriaceae bacterium]
MKKKYVLGMGVLVMSLLPMAACSSTPSGGSSVTPAANVPASVDLNGQTVVGLFTSLNNDYYANWNEGAQQAVAAFNGKYVAMTNEGDPAKQLEQFQQQVDAGVKIIFVTAPDYSDVPEMARIANQNGVCLVNTWEEDPWDSPFAYGDQYETYLSPSNEEVAYEMATTLFQKMGGTGNFVYLTGHPGATSDTQRTNGVNRALAQFPGITEMATQPGEWDRGTARDAMTGIINRYGGNKIDGVMGQNDDVAIGALNSLTEAGITGVPIVGIDGTKDAMNFIKSGEMYATYSSFPQWQAGFAFVQSLDACKSGKTPDPLNRQLWTGGMKITQDNLAQYQSTYLDNDPYDWVKMSKVAHPDDWDPQNQVTAIDMNKMWSYAPQPAGYQLPQAYADAYSTIDAVNAEWDSHWKLLRRSS